MTCDEVMKELQGRGNEAVRTLNIRNGAGANQFGVKLGDLRVMAKEIKIDHALAMELWDTGNADAMLLATLIMRPKALSEEKLDQMVRSITHAQLAEWVASYVVKAHPQKEKLRERWMKDDQPMAQRMGWSLTTERVIKNPNGLDLNHLLDRIENEMAGADPLAQWTMNYCLAEIGINFPEHRQRAIDIGEKLGVLKDYPTSKGCTSPYAPIWINEMVRRKG